MTLETATTLQNADKADFERLDADILRTSLISRYAHMLYGDLTRSKPSDDGSLTVHRIISKKINGVTFSNPAEQAHLRSRIKTATENHQNTCRCESLKALYTIQEAAVIPASDYLEVRLVTSVKQPS